MCTRGLFLFLMCLTSAPLAHAEFNPDSESPFERLGLDDESFTVEDVARQLDRAAEIYNPSQIAGKETHLQWARLCNAARMLLHAGRIPAVEIFLHEASAEDRAQFQVYLHYRIEGLAKRFQSPDWEIKLETAFALRIWAQLPPSARTSVLLAIARDRDRLRIKAGVTRWGLYDLFAVPLAGLVPLAATYLLPLTSQTPDAAHFYGAAAIGAWIQFARGILELNHLPIDHPEAFVPNPFRRAIISSMLAGSAAYLCIQAVLGYSAL